MTPRVVLDTNILISAIIFGGKPREILQLALNKKIIATTSPYLITELGEVLIKKFNFSIEKIQLITRKINKSFIIVNPTVSVNVLQDKPDNRVLEAAIEGKCGYIITGDKRLLDLGSYKNIQIIKANEFGG